MFEKEAEEYQTRKHHQRLYGNKPVVMKELNITYKDGFKDGYNKAKEEAETIIQDLLSNSDEYAKQRAIDFLKEI